MLPEKNQLTGLKNQILLLNLRALSYCNRICHRYSEKLSNTGILRLSEGIINKPKVMLRKNKSGDLYFFIAENVPIHDILSIIFWLKFCSFPELGMPFEN